MGSFQPAARFYQTRCQQDLMFVKYLWKHATTLQAWCRKRVGHKKTYKEDEIIIKLTVMLLHVIGYSEAPHIFKFTNMALVQHAEKYNEVFL